MERCFSQRSTGTKKLSRRELLALAAKGGLGGGLLALASAVGCVPAPTPQGGQAAIPTPEPPALVEPTPSPEVDKLTVIENQAYWFSRYNLNALTLMSGLGDRLTPPLEKRKAIADAVGFDLSQLPKNPYLLASVYASGELYFTQPGDFGDLSTLNWDRATLDKTLLPATQALVMIKAVDKALRSRYHETPKDKFIAKIQLEEAKAMGRLLEEKLKTPAGLYVPLSAEGSTAEARPLDQIAVLWAYAKLAVNLGDQSFTLYYEPDLADQYQELATQVFDQRGAQPPTTLTAKALALEAYGWHFVATGEQAALDRVVQLAQDLSQLEARTATEVGLRIRGLSEGGRLLDKKGLFEIATQSFEKDLEALWDEAVGVYAPVQGATTYEYTPFDVGAILGAVNSLRRHPEAGDGLRELTNERYMVFFENAVIRSGMQFAHAIPLAVNPKYLEQYPREYFTAPSVPLSIEAGGRYGYGGCPMYLSQVSYEGEWKQPTGRFETVPGMFLADMSLDNFIPLS